MPDLSDRFRALDQLEVPDIDARARALGPRPPTEPDGPSSSKRVGVIVVATLVALVGVGFAGQAFHGDRAAIPLQPVVPGAHELVAMSIGYGMTHQVGSTSRFTDIAVARPDGTGLRHVTGSPADLDADPWVARYGFSSDDSPAFSPDGRSIAFVRRYSEGIDSLCVIGVDGSGFRVVVRDLGGAELAWSPDGTKFAYYSERDGGIHVVNADGTNDRAVDPRKGGPNQNSPSWAPDSKDLYFVSGTRLYEVGSDGRGLRLAWVSDRPLSAVAVSPDGETLAVVRVDPRPGRPHAGSVWLVRPDGSDLRRLRPKSGAGIGFSAVWSPDGSRLLVAGPGERSWMIDTDGTHLQRFPSIPTASAPVAWWGPHT